MRATAVGFALASTLLAAMVPASAEQCSPDVRGAFEQLLIVKTPADEADALDRFADWAARRDIAGIFLSKRTVRGMTDPAQVSSYIARLQDARTFPLIISVDQEGGSRQTLGAANGFDALPRVAELCRNATPEELAAFAQHKLAAPIAGVGVNMNFGPVLDVALDPRSDIIVKRGRACSSDPARVSAFGIATLRGQDAAGVVSVGKHYPGHGNVSGDTHKSAVRLKASRAQLDAGDLVPFRAFIDAGGQAIMVAHVIAEAIDPNAPASLSRRVITDLLRTQHGFDGVVITDDLSMRAVTEYTGDDITAAIVAAVLAGADLVPVGVADAERLLAGLCARYDASPDDDQLWQAIRQANARTRALRGRLRPAGRN